MAIGAMKAEFTNRKSLLQTIAFQIKVGYILAMTINKIGTLVVYLLKKDVQNLKLSEVRNGGK